MDKSVDAACTPPLGSRKVCSECIRDKYLKMVVSRFGVYDTCNYCYEDSKTITLTFLAAHVKRFFNDHFVLEQNDTDAEEESEIPGNVGDTIYMEVCDGCTLVEDIQSELRLMSVDYDYDKLGTNNPFGDAAYYFEKKVDSRHWDSLWNELKRTITGENRLFNKKAKEIIETVFFGTIRVGSGESSNDSNIVEIGPSTHITNLFRAREFQSDRDLCVALECPDIEMGPPPSFHATEGRMNAKGVSVFYGATDIEVAIAEVRPAVGSRVVVANFDVIRNLKLLDITKLQSNSPPESLFRPSRKRILEKRKFISSLSERISAPVMIADRSTDYLVTQAISDYLSELEYPTSIDGLIYNSVQKGNRATNVVLFHKASCVKLRNKPKNVSASQDHEDILFPNGRMAYYVYETITEENQGDIAIGNNSVIEENSGEYREPSLSLDPFKIAVHHINSVNFDTQPQKVRRMQRDEKHKLIREN